MGCRGCGSTSGLSREQVENLVNKWLDESKLQGGIKSCDGEPLPKGAKVVLCSEFTDKVQNLIETGKIEVLTDLSIKNGKLIATDGEGNKEELDTPYITNLEVDTDTSTVSWIANGEKKSKTLPYVKGTASNKNITLTLADGTNVEFPKDGWLTEDSFDNTIIKGVNEAGKFGIKLGTGLTQEADGAISVDVKPEKLKTVRLVDASGIVVLGNILGV